MILWAFLKRSSLEVLGKSTYYMEFDAFDKTLKMYDEDFIQENIVLPNGSKGDARPISCWASCAQSSSVYALGINSFISCLGKFSYFLDVSWDKVVMVEFLAKDSDILNAKDMRNTYMTYNEAWKEDDKKNKWKYAELTHTDEIATSDYEKYVRERHSDFDVECMVDCIKPEQIISVKTFSHADAHNTVKIEDHFVHPILLPTFTGTVYVNSDGYRRELVDDKLKRIPLDDTEAQDKQGMTGVYRDMLVLEAFQVCNSNTQNNLFKVAKERKLSDDDLRHMTIGELLLTDVFITTF